MGKKIQLFCPSPWALLTAELAKGDEVGGEQVELIRRFLKTQAAITRFTSS